MTLYGVLFVGSREEQQYISPIDDIIVFGGILQRIGFNITSIYIKYTKLIVIDIDDTLDTLREKKEAIDA
jgi:hypothetical protein